MTGFNHTDRAFSAMGSECRIVVNAPGHSGLAEKAIDRISQLETRWSRFRSDSEVSGLNRGERLIVSSDTYSLVDCAISAWHATSGLFDPTMLSDLVEHGYDRTHHDLAPSGSGQVLLATSPRTTRHTRVGEIQLFPEQSGVMLPAGVQFDPGGIGKGLAADIVAAEVMAQGAEGVMVSLGGDLRVEGSHPDYGPVWEVEVDPRLPGHDGRLIGLTGGGIATSSQIRRRWATTDGDRHHLLDPSTGDPSISMVAVAVVSGPMAWQADVVAKAALLAGLDRGPEIIAETGSTGLLFDMDGQCHDVGLLEATSRH